MLHSRSNGGALNVLDGCVDLERLSKCSSALDYVVSVVTLINATELVTAPGPVGAGGRPFLAHLHFERRKILRKTLQNGFPKIDQIGDQMRNL